MEIIKQLNLNGNPQTVPNGSLVYAKNIKISPDGTYISNDDGFNSAFIETEPDISNLKVSNIRTSIFDGNSDISLFYSSIPLKENTEYVTYVEQKIAGYINCPNEIVLFVYRKFYNRGALSSSTEIYRAIELKDSNKLALYLVPANWTYSGGNIVGTYLYNAYGQLIIAIGESGTETDKELVTINLNESTFDDFKDKYSCAPNVPIANLSLVSKIKGSAMPHGLYYFFIRYEVAEDLYTSWFPIGAPQYALSLDYKTIFNHFYATNNEGGNTQLTKASFLVNTDKDSYYNFNFRLEFDNTYNYSGFEIGYILQTEDTSVGRIWNSFTFNGLELTKTFTFNGGFIEEADIEELTKNVINVYNVKALTEYNSKLYIANFKETDYNVDLQSYADEINTFLVRKRVDTVNVEKSSTLMVTWTYYIDGIDCPITVTSITPSIRLADFPDLLTALNTHIYWYPGYNADVLEYLGVDTIVEFNANKLVLKPSIPTVSSNFEKHDTFYENGDDYCFGAHTSSGQGGWGWFPNGVLDKDLVRVTKEETTKNYSTYNTDNVIRSLMPHEVYAFYVHYVRPDGSYTNGLPLQNKNVNDAVLYKRVGDLTSAEKSQYGLTNISTIDEIADKYLYEIYIPDTNTEKSNFGLYVDNFGKKLFKTGSGYFEKTIDGNTVKCLTRLGVRFENITYPDGYIGAFFSYEKVNALSVYQGYVSDQITNNSSVLIKSSDSEFSNVRYDGLVFIPHHKIENGDIVGVSSEPKFGYINNSAPVLSNASINFEGDILNRIGTHGGIAMNISKAYEDNYQPSVGIVGSVILFNKSIYANDVKELIPFGPIVTRNVNYYGESLTNSDTAWYNNVAINYDINYPSFLVQDKVLTYKYKIAVNENASLNYVTDNVINTGSYLEYGQYVNADYVWKFSNLNLLALSIKKEPESVSGVVKNSDNTVNVLVKPINASDLFKLESCYLFNSHKAYTNYNDKLRTPNVFTNVIRATYPIRNESVVNSWRLIDPFGYYVIDNANNEIINIFGASSSFFIHTKNNLLVTTSNAKLSADNTEINIVDNKIFDVEPKELFSSELGYGGLKHRVCHLYSQFGYIWYDTERYKLFRYDNSQLTDMTSGLDELIRKYRYEYCYINIDNDNNRMLFSFVRDNKTLTMSYETLTGKWISIHDYVFDKSIHTANIALFTHSTKAPIELYYYDSSQTKCYYRNLFELTPDLPYYSVSGNAYYCCFDIIFNANYMTPKVLDSISWAHEFIEPNTLDSNHPAELESLFKDIDDKLDDIKDLKMIVYSDSVDSGLLNLRSFDSKPNNVTDAKSYQKAYYNKGVWNYNYFRNNNKAYLNPTELSALCQKYNIDEDSPYFAKLKKVYKVTNRNGQDIYRSSDMNSLIYGKYIVVRFIFQNSSDKLKFDNLIFNLKEYI